MGEDTTNKGYSINIKDLEDGQIKISVEGESKENSNAYKLTLMVVTMLKKIQDGEPDELTA